MKCGADQSKFESELTKYMSGKSEKIIPENVIDHLIDLINDQEFQAKSISDLVTLNILASNLSSKSCSSASLKKLKDDYKLYNDFSKPEVRLSALKSGPIPYPWCLSPLVYFTRE